ncbi:Adenylate cyclase [Diplonema papillatum]|nr:Adenylate cyclase [Diplonema papillatum]
MKWRFLDRFLSWIEVPGEPEAERRRKKVWVIEQSCVGGVCLCLFPLIWDWPGYNICAGASIFLSAVTLSVIAVLHLIPNAVVDLIVVCKCLAIVATDSLNASTNDPRWWPIFMIVLDLLLFSGERAKATHVMHFVVLWLFLISAEEAFRFGVFDIPGIFPSYATRSEKLLVFLVDFILTRRFSDQVMSEKIRVEASVHAANDIASALAAFDLPGARDRLNVASAGNLPAELAGALEQLLANLTAYRPYLPDALFDQADGLGLDIQAAPPRQGAPGLAGGGVGGDGVATIVFTDIVQSTAIWNACGDEMKRSLQLHNALVRAALAQYDGYEVKTIGDSFMAAFDEPVAAVQFSLAVHAALYTASWPAHLLTIPHCAAAPPTWRGLRLRIGVHRGPVSVEKNTIVDRYDYFGPTVNTAARLESQCLPGCVAALPDLAAEVEQAWTGLLPCTPSLWAAKSCETASSCEARIGDNTAALPLGMRDPRPPTDRKTRHSPVERGGSSCFRADNEEPGARWGGWGDTVATLEKMAVLKGIGETVITVFAAKTFAARLHPHGGKGVAGRAAETKHGDELTGAASPDKFGG